MTSTSFCALYLAVPLINISATLILPLKKFRGHFGFEHGNLGLEESKHSIVQCCPSEIVIWTIENPCPMLWTHAHVNTRVNSAVYVTRVRISLFITWSTGLTPSWMRSKVWVVAVELLWYFFRTVFSTLFRITSCKFKNKLVRFDNMRNL